MSLTMEQINKEHSDELIDLSIFEFDHEMDEKTAESMKELMQYLVDIKKFKKKLEKRLEQITSKNEELKSQLYKMLENEGLKNIQGENGTFYRKTNF